NGPTYTPSKSLLVGVKISLFFFSSRRRHTMSKRDWSSDVCSSDLSTNSTLTSWPYKSASRSRTKDSTERCSSPIVGLVPTEIARSEERRVGRERRDRKAADP